MPSLPTMFIGSSSEGLEIAEYLQSQLEDYCEGTIWDQGAFGLSGATLDSLIDTTSHSDFATFVLTPDDLVTKRGDTHAAARDNVLFELGLFFGTLGRDRTFIVHPKTNPPDIPSDLAGITRAPYNNTRSDKNLRAALRPVSLKIREAMGRAKPRQTLISASNPPMHEVSTTTDALLTPEFPRYLHDLLESLSQGIAGINFAVSDEAALRVWSGNLLGMLYDLFSRRREDVYAAWLRPPAGQPRKLSVFDAKHLPSDYAHYEFRLNEGLAGKVWSTGTPAAQSVIRQHPWWVFREGCENSSYICSAVGRPGGSGGIIAVGSDLGFTVEDSDLEVVKIFAAVLSMAAK